MRNVCGVWMPDRKDVLDGFLIKDGGTYQYHKLIAVLAHVKSWRNAVDVGGHVGLWSMHLTKRFQNVYAFEPIPEHQDCFRRNAPEAELIPFALGDHEGEVRMTIGKETSGDTRVTDNGPITAQLKTLDSFKIPDVDFIKLDCEGYELFALKGGEQTIDEYHPVIIVEQKPGKAGEYGLGSTDAVKWLQEKGYELQKAIAGDYILT